MYLIVLVSYQDKSTADNSAEVRLTHERPHRSKRHKRGLEMAAA